ncbi:hypothetical protein ACFCWG_11170 [Streptomyces sp. NPDC056390]|uniref:hypothetical protein n=1 Tax=Streptomyces sp. NPDC056390 TaxID=3345806 RepID=UPI0035DD147D
MTIGEPCPTVSWAVFEDAGPEEFERGSATTTVGTAGGRDDLRGDAGADTLRAGPGDDDLDGGADGPDACDGEAGTDSATQSCETTPDVP